MNAAMPAYGDCTALGANMLCCNANFNNEALKMHEKNIDALDKENNSLFKYLPDK